MSETTTVLGKQPPSVGNRDAIHIPVISVEAMHALVPGQPVGVNEGGKGSYYAKHVGIVDPFLKDMVQMGQRFWLCLFPGTITSLRHVWTHPAFPVEATETQEKEVLATMSYDESKKWLEDFANSVGLSYEEIIDGAINFLETGMPYSNGSRTETARDDMYEGLTAEEFWRHFSIVTNRPTNGREDNPFSCSC